MIRSFLFALLLVGASVGVAMAQNVPATITAGANGTQSATTPGGGYVITSVAHGPPTTVAALPSCTAALVGTLRNVTDSTAVASDGQTCAGSGTNTALAICGNTGAGTYGWKCH